MKAVVVYESFWGNTAAIARSIAEGIGSGARGHRRESGQGAGPARSLATLDALVARRAPRGGAAALPRSRRGSNGRPGVPHRRSSRGSSVRDPARSGKGSASS